MKRFIRAGVVFGWALVAFLGPFGAASVFGESLAGALYQVGEDRHVESLGFVIRNLYHPEADIRRIAARALGKLDRHEAIPYLVDKAGDQGESVMVRCAAITSLGRLGDPRVYECLQKLAYVNDRQIKEAALATFARLQP